MKAKILFRTLLILCFTTLSVSSCSKDKTDEEIIEGLELVTKTHLIIADNKSSTIIKVWRGLNSISTDEYSLTLNGEPIVLENFSFTTDKPGTYTFGAEYKGIPLNNIQIIAREDKAYSKISIPVIFHNGYSSSNASSNVSKLLIDKSLELLNQVFANQLVSREPNAVDTHIEFRLATLNLDGEALIEPGILRHNIAMYDTGCSQVPAILECDGQIENDQALGELEARLFFSNTIWDPSKYVNIWVYPFQENFDLGGYANQFPLVDESFPLDGINGVSRDEEISLNTLMEIEGNYFPTFAVKYEAVNSKTLAHEMGHLLGLFHPHSENCYLSDYSADTYSYDDISDQECEGNMGSKYPTSVMDYKGEKDCFTYDQRERMRHVLEHGVLFDKLKNSDR